MTSEAEHELIRLTALDYFEGWYDADPARIGTALDDGLVKRSFGAEGPPELGRTLDKAGMVELTDRGGGQDAGPVAEQEIEVEVLDVHHGTASVVVRSREYHEHLHLVRTASGWRIVNALWEPSG